MSRIVSFSADDEFAENLDGLIERSGYQNRSRFLRDAALFYAEIQQRGDLENMEDDVIIQGHILIYYQHGIENKLLDIRHSADIDVSSYNHSCLKTSHSCVDIIEGCTQPNQFNFLSNEHTKLSKRSFCQMLHQ